MLRYFFGSARDGVAKVLALIIAHRVTTLRNGMRGLLSASWC